MSDKYIHQAVLILLLSPLPLRADSLMPHGARAAQVGATLSAETSGGDGSVDFFFFANYRLLLVVPFFVNIRVRVSLSNADKDGKRV